MAGLGWLIIGEGTRTVAVVFIFFFQAEDGIRDYKVTGVQTCALPIYRGRSRSPPSAAARDRRRAAGTPRRSRRDRGADRSRATPWAAPRRRTGRSRGRFPPDARARPPRRSPCSWRRRTAP